LSALLPVSLLPDNSPVTKITNSTAITHNHIRKNTVSVSPRSSIILPHAMESAFLDADRSESISFCRHRNSLILVYPLVHVSFCFSAGRPSDRSVDSITLKDDRSSDRVHSERAARQDPDREGNPNSGGRIYNSRVIVTSDGARTASSGPKRICDVDVGFPRETPPIEKVGK